MKEQLANIRAQALAAFEGAKDSAALDALRVQYLPATINYRTAYPDCDLDYVPNQGRPAPIRYALSNSLGFGGHNACLLFKHWEG